MSQTTIMTRICFVVYWSFLCQNFSNYSTISFVCELKSNESQSKRVSISSAQTFNLSFIADFSFTHEGMGGGKAVAKFMSRLKGIKWNDCQSSSCMNNRLKNECELDRKVLSSRFRCGDGKIWRCKPGGKTMVLFWVKLQKFFRLFFEKIWNGLCRFFIINFY